MLFQYASDLHLEFKENAYYFASRPLIPSAPVLLLAGDICTLKNLERFDEVLDMLSRQFDQVYWIPGNHEYYHFDLFNKCGSFATRLRHNVFLVNDFAVTIEGSRLIFSTLWSHVSLLNRPAVERGMNDFHLISYNGERLNANITNRLHLESLRFIKGELTNLEPDQKSIVVTHHVPTFANYPPQYLGTALNEGFATNLDNLIQECGPDVWIYGHHHQNIPGFQLGNTQLLTNQMGYVAHHEHLGFDPAKVIQFPGQENKVKLPKIKIRRHRL